MRPCLRGESPAIAARILALALTCALAGPSRGQSEPGGPPAPPASQPAASAPASRPAEPETIAQARQRLVPPAPPPRPRPAPRRRGRSAPAQEPRPEPPRPLSDHELALLTAIDFTLALGRADGGRAAELLDATGYQPLPLSGDLPEDPPALLSRAALRDQLTGRAPAHYDRIPADTLVVCRADELRVLFPAVADWMLPADFAVVFQPEPGVADWVRQPACLVIRVRARKPAVLGGNLLAALLREP